MTMTPNNPVLFITLSNIGDAIMTTPVLQALHTVYPEKKIDIVADQRSSEIFFYCPFRGEIFIKNKKSFLRGTPKLLGKLWSRHYDLVVDLRTDGLAYLLRSKIKLTKWYRGETDKHAVQQHMDVIGSIYSNKPTPECHIWTGQADERYAQLVLGDIIGKRILALGPGANYQKKIWPSENYIALINKLAGMIDAVILLGNRQDGELSKVITVPAGLPTLDLCGRTTILQAAAVMRYATIFVGNDSGPGHIAAALGVPTITIFGPGEPECYCPWSKNSQYVIGDGNDIKNASVEDVIDCIFRLTDKIDNT
jgi:heptosyltransferase III